MARYVRSLGLHRLETLDPKPPVQRYEHEHPGELVHLDTKRLVRFRRPGHRVTGDRTVESPGAGWEYLHVAVDDHTRLAYSEILKDEKKETAAAFWLRARAFFEDCISGPRG